MRLSTFLVCLAGIFALAMFVETSTAGDRVAAPPAAPAVAAAPEVEAGPVRQTIRERSVRVERRSVEPVCGPNGCETVTSRLVERRSVNAGQGSRGGLLSRLRSRRGSGGFFSRNRSLGCCR